MTRNLDCKCILKGSKFMIENNKSDKVLLHEIIQSHWGMNLKIIFSQITVKKIWNSTKIFHFLHTKAYIRRHLISMTSCLFFKSKVPKQYLAETYNCSAYIINRLPTKILGFKSPYSLLYDKEPNMKYLRVYHYVSH